jgi:hypothetical protein
MRVSVNISGIAMKGLLGALLILMPSGARAEEPADLAGAPAGESNEPAAESNAKEPSDQSRPAPPTREELASLIAKLDSDSYLEREKATQALVAAGAPALAPLLAAANADLPESADRALWILRRQTFSPNNDLAIAALEHLVQVSGRAAVVDKAKVDLARRRVAACQEKLKPLGAELEFQTEAINLTGTVAKVVIVRISNDWRGQPEDLRMVAQLEPQAHFELSGQVVTDEIVKFFEEKPSLGLLRLLNTQVTPPAVDSLKLKHPDAIVYIKNQALLGVQAEKHAAGVIVLGVQPRSGAENAGIIPGDIITAIDGHKLPDFDRMTVRIGQHKPGETIQVEILRNGEPQRLSVTLGSWAEQGG